MYQLTKEKIEKGINAKEFITYFGDLVIHVEDVDKDTGEWKDVWISDNRTPKSPSITMAKYGKMTSDIKSMNVQVILSQGSIHRANAEVSQIVTFDRYILSIPINPPANKNTKLGKSTLNMKELQEHADMYGRNTKIGKAYLVHYHKRLVLPAGCLIISLMALPLGLQSGPGRKAVGIPLGLGFFIFYYVVYTIGKTLAADSNIPVWFGMWVPNVVLILVAISAINRVAHEKTLIPDNLQNSLHKMNYFLFSRWFSIKQK